MRLEQIRCSYAHSRSRSGNTLLRNRQRLKSWDMPERKAQNSPMNTQMMNWTKYFWFRTPTQLLTQLKSFKDPQPCIRTVVVHLDDTSMTFTAMMSSGWFSDHTLSTSVYLWSQSIILANVDAFLLTQVQATLLNLQSMHKVSNSEDFDT